MRSRRGWPRGGGAFAFTHRVCLYICLILLPLVRTLQIAEEIDITRASAAELEEYRQHLTKQLRDITDRVEKLHVLRKSKRFIASPLSASLPNRDSPYFLERIQALSKSTPPLEQLEEQFEKEALDDPKLIELLSGVADEVFTGDYNSTEVEGSGEEPTTTPLIPLAELANDSLIVPSTTVTTSTTTTKAPGQTSLDDSPAFVTEKPTAAEIRLEEREERREPPAHPNQARGPSFNPTINHTLEECRKLSQKELVSELKQKGTYNPDLMAWDVIGVLRFLDRTITDQYEMQIRNRSRGEEAAERNVEALARILGELDVTCDDVKSDRVRARMHNITMTEPRRTILSPTLRRRRHKREAIIEELAKLLASIGGGGGEKEDETTTTSTSTTSTTTTPPPSTTSTSAPSPPTTPSPSAWTTQSTLHHTVAPIYETIGKRQKLIGESHVVPFGCDRRGTQEDGFLRLCSACQSIRRLPDTFFPPFINEVTCDEDNACLYFYDYPHGRCRQKHMNFVVLRNIGTPECQVWRKFNLNVRVSCECFVDEMSFFAKYV